MRTTRDIAQWIHSMGYNDLAAEVIERTKDLSLSALGAAVYGVSMDTASILARYARGSGGPQEAGIIGAGFKASAELAALVNTAASHNTELEDVAVAEAMPTVNVIPAIFAMGEKLGLPGRDVLAAVVLAFEVSARPSMNLANAPDGCFQRGFMPGPILATIGVAAAAAKMLGSGVEQITNAMSLAASSMTGLHRQCGTGAHVIEPGLAARNGIAAATFAQAGITGDPTILEGEAGLWDAIGGDGDLDFDLGRGSNFRIMEVGMKRYPCCYLIQRVIDGIIELVRTYHLRPDQIESVVVQGNKYFRSVISQDEPRDGEEARFSLPHAIAVALTGDRVFFEAFTVEAVKNPRYQSIWSKVRFEPHPDWDSGTNQKDSPLTIRLTTGQELTKVCVRHRGDPRDPLTREEVGRRFGSCVEHALLPAQIDEAVSLAASLDRVEDVSDLMVLLTGSM